MNKIDCLYTTVSLGKTYIAADDKYIGCVNSYNNFITQFFAWVLNLSIKVNFDGNIRSVNRESYENFINSLRNKISLAKIQDQFNFRCVAENMELSANSLKMRDVINQSDRVALFKKLAEAITKGDAKKALLLIGKGAELDTIFYDRGAEQGLAFGDFKSDLNEDQEYEFSVLEGPPILHAIQKENHEVIEKLKKFGAKENVKGRKYLFRRIWVSKPLPITGTFRNRMKNTLKHDKRDLLPTDLEYFKDKIYNVNILEGAAS